MRWQSLSDPPTPTMPPQRPLPPSYNSVARDGRTTADSATPGYAEVCSTACRIASPSVACCAGHSCPALHGMARRTQHGIASHRIVRVWKVGAALDSGWRRPQGELATGAPQRPVGWGRHPPPCPCCGTYFVPYRSSLARSSGVVSAAPTAGYRPIATATATATATAFASPTPPAYTHFPPLTYIKE
jgi:hypothetical protein